jgi:acetoacetate decarboxylase
MSGQLWLSLFRVPRDIDADRPRGLYGVAFVRYLDPSPLTYDELLVARAPEGEKAVTITDIWVDSPASMAGGRELWAIPKELCDFELGLRPRLVGDTARWSTHVDGRPIASATFHDVSRMSVRFPFKGATLQTRETGERVSAELTGSARMSPCLGSWTFDPDGPLGWLTGRRALLSFRQRDFRMTFG